MCARRDDARDGKPPATPPREASTPHGVPQAVEMPGGAMLADFVANVTGTLNPERRIEVLASPEELDKARAAKDAARKARDTAIDGVRAARASLEAAEKQLAALVPDVGERERRIELVRNGEPVGVVDVDELLDGVRAGVDGVVAQCSAADAQRVEAESALADKRTEVERLRGVAAAIEVEESLRALQQAREQLDLLEEGVREKREASERVAAELRESRRALDGIKADIAAVEVHLPGARVAADGAREEVRRRDKESCRALDLLVDELEKATEESAAVLRLAEANLDRSVVREVEATKDVFAARIRRAEAVMKSIVSAKERREKAVNEVLEQCD